METITFTEDDATELGLALADADTPEELTAVVTRAYLLGHVQGYLKGVHDMAESAETILGGSK